MSSAPFWRHGRIGWVVAKNEVKREKWWGNKLLFCYFFPKNPYIDFINLISEVLRSQRTQWTQFCFKSLFQVIAKCWCTLIAKMIDRKVGVGYDYKLPENPAVRHLGYVVNLKHECFFSLPKQTFYRPANKGRIALSVFESIILSISSCVTQIKSLQYFFFTLTAPAKICAFIINSCNIMSTIILKTDNTRVVRNLSRLAVIGSLWMWFIYAAGLVPTTQVCTRGPRCRSIALEAAYY